VFSAIPQGAPVAEYHQDAMLQVPEGAVVLASTPACPVQGYRLGDRAWATQFHPEVDAEILGSWFGDDAEPLRKAGTDPETIMSDMAARETEMRAAWKAFALAFADVVRQGRGSS
jgi:GMP synthase-like glutamine amidotransferase